MKKLLFVALFSVCLVSLTRSADANRLDDPNYNRCAGDAQIPPAECEQYQEFAWNAGAGCITFEEYLYARQNFVAPICSQFVRTEYMGYCRCGCLAKETQVYVEQNHVLQWVPVDNLPGHEAEVSMLTLSKSATMTSWDFATPGLMAMTIGPEKAPLVWVKTMTGLVIGLTETHGVLLANGFMARAVELKPGDSLVNMDGEAEIITSIERRQTTEDVYNVLTNAGTANKAGHIIFANELAVGDLYWQNILESEFRKVAVRE
jgi:hypothetical protein